MYLVFQKFTLNIMRPFFNKWYHLKYVSFICLVTHKRRKSRILLKVKFVST